jgi:cytoskeletal protein RodZ
MAGQPELKLVRSDEGPCAGGLETLQSARRARGETLEQAARYTRIRLPYLRALEDGDTSSLDTYPGRLYVRYFLREYAEHLGVEPGPLLRQFDRAGPALEPLPSPPIWQRLPHARRWAVGALVLLIALLTANALLPFGSAERPTPPLASDASSHVAPSQPSPQAHVAPPVPPDGVRAVIHTTGPCWIRAVVDGSIAMEETVPAGKTVRFRASDQIELRLGNAGGVALSVNGRPMPTGRPGEIVDLSFAWRGGRLVRLP